MSLRESTSSLASTQSRKYWFFALVVALVIGSYWRSTQISPAQHLVDYGVVLQEQGNDAGAESQWREAIRLDPNNTEGLVLLGNYYFQTREYKQAQSVLEKAFALDSTIPGIQVRLAECAYRTRDFVAAQRYAQAQLKQDPNDIKALEILANAEQQVGNSDLRVKHLEQLVKLQPQSPTALTDLINELGKRQEYDKGVPLTERLVRLAPNAATSYYLRGQALFVVNPTSDQLKRAAADFHKVLSLDPSIYQAHRFLGQIYMRLNRPQEAIAEYKQVGYGRPYASGHLLELSQAYRRVGDIRSADQVLALFTHLKQFNGRAISLNDSLKHHPENTQNALEEGLLLLHGLESEEKLFQLYRYQYLNGELRSVSYYLNLAARDKPGDLQINQALSRLETAYTKRLKAARQAFERGDKAAATLNVSYVVLLREEDRRTQNILRDFKAGGVNSLGTIPRNFASS